LYGERTSSCVSIGTKKLGAAIVLVLSAPKSREGRARHHVKKKLVGRTKLLPSEQIMR
jgi:hypothetical protein